MKSQVIKTSNDRLQIMVVQDGTKRKLLLSLSILESEAELLDMMRALAKLADFMTGEQELEELPDSV